MCLSTLQIFNEVFDGTGSCWKEKNYADVGRFLLPSRKLASSFKMYLSIIKTGRHQSTFGNEFFKTFALAALKGPSFLLVSWKKERNILYFLLSFLSLFSTKTKGDFSKSLYQHYLTFFYGFDQITDQIPQNENWKFVVISTPHPQWQIFSFPSFFIFLPMGKILLV